MSNKVAQSGSYKHFLASNAEQTYQARLLLYKTSDSKSYPISDESVSVSESSTCSSSQIHDRYTASPRIHRVIFIYSHITKLNIDSWLYPLITKCAHIVAYSTTDLRPGCCNPASTQLQILQSSDIIMYINFAKVDIDYWLYPQSYKYAYVVAYLTHNSRHSLVWRNLFPGGTSGSPSNSLSPGVATLLSMIAMQEWDTPIRAQQVVHK